MISLLLLVLIIFCCYLWLFIKAVFWAMQPELSPADESSGIADFVLVGVLPVLVATGTAADFRPQGVDIWLGVGFIVACVIGYFALRYGQPATQNRHYLYTLLTLAGALFNWGMCIEAPGAIFVFGPLASLFTVVGWRCGLARLPPLVAVSLPLGAGALAIPVLSLALDVL